MGNGDLPTIKNLGACQKIVKNSATDIFDQVFPKTKNPKKKNQLSLFWMLKKNYILLLRKGATLCRNVWLRNMLF